MSECHGMNSTILYNMDIVLLKDIPLVDILIMAM